jgi:hypothetical protein
MSCACCHTVVVLQVASAPSGGAFAEEARSWLLFFYQERAAGVMLSGKSLHRTVSMMAAPMGVSVSLLGASLRGTMFSSRGL